MPNSDQQPDDNQDSDDDCPECLVKMPNAVGCNRTIIDHDPSPAHQLEDIEQGKELTPLLAKADLSSVHRAEPPLPTDYSGEKQQEAADDVTNDDHH